MENRIFNGITIAGNIIVDVVNIIDVYPRKNMLVDIYSSKKAVGGCVCNTIIDIAKIDPSMKLTALGKVGNDGYGDYALDVMKSNGINIDKITRSTTGTSYTQVMTEKDSGDRTFFTYKGANSDFDIDDVDVEALDCRMFHAGYILLLDKFDEADEEYGTRMARLLDRVQKRGIKTSIDVISEEGTRFREKVVPALKYCDYAILNETESCAVTGLEERNADGTLNIENIKATMEKFLEYGVKEAVIVHSAEAGFMLEAGGNFTYVKSLKIDKSLIKGSTGAGDAYCGACLYGIHNGYESKRLLEFASCAAAASLFESDSVSGMKCKAEIEKMNEEFERL